MDRPVRCISLTTNLRRVPPNVGVVAMIDRGLRQGFPTADLEFSSLKTASEDAKSGFGKQFFWIETIFEDEILVDYNKKVKYQVIVDGLQPQHRQAHATASPATPRIGSTR